MGLWAAPTGDLIYQHHNDDELLHSCTPLHHSAPYPCDNGSNARWPEERAWHERNGRQACTPHAECPASYEGLHPRRYGLSNAPLDFFYLAELRLHILHALGFIDWVWFSEASRNDGKAAFETHPYLRAVYPMLPPRASPEDLDRLYDGLHYYFTCLLYTSPSPRDS